MTTTSYPITGENLDHAQWSKLLRRHHQGVDTGLALSLSSTSNDATIATGRANFLGFELEVTAPHVVTLAAVASTTTYVIAIRYDPALEAAAAGPLSIVSGVKGAISVPTGGSLWPLWEVTRNPSQTLNLAAVKSYKVSRSALLYAPTGVDDPDPTAPPQGVQLVVRKTGFTVWDGTSWTEVKDDTGDVGTGVTMGTAWAAAGTLWSVLNGVVFLDAAATLKSGNTIATTAQGSITDSVVLTLPSSARPRRMWAGSGSITLGSNNVTYHVGVRVNLDGRVILTSGPPSLSIPAGTAIYVSAAYRRPAA